MDKTKLIAIGALLVLGGFLLFSKMNDPALPSADDGDNNAQPTAIAAPPAATNAVSSDPATNAVSSDPATNAASGNSDVATPVTEPVTELKIIDERVGTGPVAKTGDQLSMNYLGTLLNGQEFDSSYGKAPFDVAIGTGRVIEGWDKGIPGMKVGGKRKLIIPSEMAYGEQGSGGTIPPNSPLIFEVELLSVNGKTS